MKKRTSGKKYVALLAVTVALAALFLWWLGAKVEEMGRASAGATTTAMVKTETSGLRQFVSGLFGDKNKEGETTAKSAPAKNPDKKQVVPIVAPVFTLASLKLTDNETSTSLSVYGRQVATALKPLGTPRENEANLLLKVFEDKDEEAALAIYQAAKVHQQILANLKAIAVPRSAGPLHLEVMKKLASTMVMLANMSKADKDPALAVGNGLTYQNEALALFDAIAKLNSYFAEQGIIFAKEDRITIFINVDEPVQDPV